MKIGIVCHSSVGGSARVATEVAFRLQSRGHLVCLFSERIPFALDPRHAHIQHRSIEKVEQTQLSTPQSALHVEWTEKQLDSLRKLISAYCIVEGLDVLHIHYAVPFVSLVDQIAQTCGAAAPALVVTLHGTDVSVYCAEPDQAALVRRWLEPVDAITTVSKAHARLSQELINIPQEPLVIHNFIDPTRFFPDNNSGIPFSGPTARPLRIAYVSNFRPVKAPEVAARIFCDFRKRHRAEFWLMGDGEHMARLRKIIAEHHLTGDCRYFGLKDNLAEILRQADVCIVPSRKESFGLAALEAMASGLPIIASDTGGLPELIGDTNAGFVFPVGDYRSASRLLERLVIDPRLYKDMSRASVKRARQFNSRTIVDQYEDLYFEVIRKRKTLRKRDRPANDRLTIKEAKWAV